MSGKLRRKIWEKFQKKCQICGRITVLFGNTVSPFKETISCAIDHIKPISKGGECCEENLQLLCITCNSQKGSKYV